MDSIPAKIAGCREIVMVTPPSANGKVAAPILAAAKIAGIDRVFKIGGAQAIAAAVFMARTGKTKEEIKQYISEMFGYDLDRTVDEIRPDYRFEVECWPDNGTIKRFSVFRDDMGVEIQYISDHQDAL